MSLILPDHRSSVDEFLDWSKYQVRGKYELFDGVVVPQQSRRWGHARVKLEVAILLRQAVAQASLACSVAPVGMTVRPPSGGKAFEPDTLLAALPEPDLGPGIRCRYRVDLTGLYRPCRSLGLSRL